MKSTGVLRRVDDLGRVVIPKEIRKNLKIRDGESLEIFIDNSNIILSKYSAVDSMSNIAQTAADAMFEAANINLLITDRDKVIAASSILKKRYLDQELNDKTIDAIFKREVYNEREKPADIVNGITEESYSIVVPIIGDGDPIGSVIMISQEKKDNQSDEKMGIFLAKFLSKFS